MMKSRSKLIIWFAIDFLVGVLCILASVLLAVNFDMRMFAVFTGSIAYYSLFLCIPYFVVSLFLKNYRVMWMFAGTLEFARLCVSALVSVGVFTLCGTFFRFNDKVLPVSTYIILAVLFCGVLCVVRAAVKAMQKAVKYLRNSDEADIRTSSKDVNKERIMVIGAGSAANMFISDTYKNEAFRNSVVVCAVDDNDSKVGQYINGVKVVGTRHDIISAAKRYKVDTIVFAIPTLDKNDRAEILKICAQTGCKLKSMPSIDEIIEKHENKFKLKKVEVEDLLERMPIKIDTAKLMNYVENKVILVTGGGGSIGSELCRQIAAHNPKQLIIFDVYENNAYDILNELKSTRPDVNVLALIGSVRDSIRMENIFRDYKPQIVYHAAAHKHVPLMEDSPNEAIKNNVFGTLKTAQAASKYGVERFVLISTDKAVNPTNVMGASKRLCEMVVQSMSRCSKTEFVAVRFGNVLGSNGSVIPLFKKQIEAGGPVLVTHPDVIRYFMTIPEAVSLVLTAGAIAKGGEIFVLDMGKPVKILDLAKNMIRLMGYEIDKDIKIEFTGLRPGEKLFEELLMDEEGLQETENHLIHIGQPLVFDDDWFMSKLDEMKEVMYDDNADIRSLIHELVPTYKMPKK